MGQHAVGQHAVGGVAGPAGDWRVRARCRGEAPGAFFPRLESSPQSAAAKAVCRRCAVRAECLEYALAAREPFGIWGGTSARERATHPH